MLQKLCAGENTPSDPSQYLVAHPADCTRFVSCQWLGGDRYLAHVMRCPANTFYSRGLVVCNHGQCLREKQLARARSSGAQGPQQPRGRGTVARVPANTATEGIPPHRRPRKRQRISRQRVRSRGAQTSS